MGVVGEGVEDDFKIILDQLIKRKMVLLIVIQNKRGRIGLLEKMMGLVFDIWRLYF